MFGKRKSGGPGEGVADTAAERRAAEALTRARKERPAAARKDGASDGSDAPRRAGGGFRLPGTRGVVPALPVDSRTGQSRKLVVGRDISLSGEIKACETLIVEGRVEADLKGCQVLQISASGLYKGTAEVDEADISGHFDGDLTVQGTLILRATGRVSGRLRYLDMEIERGGKLSGTLEDIVPSDGQASGAGRASAKAKPASGRSTVEHAKARVARTSQPSTV